MFSKNHGNDGSTTEDVQRGVSKSTSMLQKMKRSIIEFLRQRLPRSTRLYREIRQRVSEYRSVESVFVNIYHKNVWESEESISGPGSTLEQTDVIRQHLPSLLRQINAKSLLDAPCGDFNWMKSVSLPIEKYIGVDIVEKLIEHHCDAYGDANHIFLKRELTKDSLPLVDVILCRDCLVHLSYKMALAVLHNFKISGSTYLLTTHYPAEEENFDIVTGGWRAINLERAPFYFSPPILTLDEQSSDCFDSKTGKTLALWKLDNLLIPDCK